MKKENVREGFEAVAVNLDADTASQWLILTEDGKRVSGTNTEQTPPDNLKRFTVLRSVLGSEGFTSGRHYWEIHDLQVAGWYVGVARESVNRKERADLTPDEGFWVMYGFSGEYQAVTTPDWTPLSPRENPRKLGVYLDYEGGSLSLHNAETMEHLYTFANASFTDRIFPFFFVYPGAELGLV